MYLRLQCIWKISLKIQVALVQSDSVVSDSLRLIDCNMPGFPILHHLPEFVQTHVYGVGEAIQPFHPLSSPSPPAFNLSKQQGLFQGVSSSNLPSPPLYFLHSLSQPLIFKSPITSMFIQAKWAFLISFSVSSVTPDTADHLFFLILLP